MALSRREALTEVTESHRCKTVLRPVRIKLNPHLFSGMEAVFRCSEVHAVPGSEKSESLSCLESITMLRLRL